MIAATKRQQVMERVRGALGKTAKEYRDAIECETAFARAHLQPGQEMPKIRVMTGTRRDAFARTVDAIRVDALNAIDELQQAIDDEVTAAPSEEAIRALQALSMRKTVTETELQSFTEKYGDNYQARKVIRGLADPDLMEVDEVEAALSEVEDMRETVKRQINSDALLERRVTPGSIMFASQLAFGGNEKDVNETEGGDADAE